MSVKIKFNELVERGWVDADSHDLKAPYVILDTNKTDSVAIFYSDIFLEDYFEDPFNPTETEKALLKLQKGVEIIYD